MTYDSIYGVLNNINSKDFLYTIEFYPEEGKYHYDGHDACDVCFSPSESKKNKGVCPKCGKGLTIGVMNRVEELADRTEAEALKLKRVPFKSLIPLKEIISQMLKVGEKSLKVIKYYDKLISVFGNELDILIKVEKKEFDKNGFKDLGDLIYMMKENKVIKIPGYDGRYGVIKIID